MSESNNSSELQSDENDDENIDEDVDDIRDGLYFVFSSMGYITRISQNSRYPERLTIKVYGNRLMHCLYYLEFLIVVLKVNPDLRMIYNFYAFFYVKDELKFTFGALTIDRLIHYIQKGIKRLELRHCLTQPTT